MLIKVERFSDDGEATLSSIYIDGKFLCFGLEDEHRTTKVYAETRIPAGRYKVVVRQHGGFHGRYSTRFPAFHEGMLEVMDVPGFTDILIHIGNDDDDTAGCLLVAKNATTFPHTIPRSGPAYEALYKAVIDAAKAGELEIEYIDRDREGLV